MTYREKLKQERPDAVDPNWIGGCCGCPGEYWTGGPITTACGSGGDRQMCTRCWDTEIPAEERQHHFPAGCRPCEVDGQPALFHRWVEEETGVLIVNFFATEDMADSLRRKFEKDGIVAGGCSLEKMRQTLALIEWPGGTVETVPVTMIRFTDKEG